MYGAVPLRKDRVYKPLNVTAPFYRFCDRYRKPDPFLPFLLINTLVITIQDMVMSINAGNRAFGISSPVFTAPAAPPGVCP